MYKTHLSPQIVREKGDPLIKSCFTWAGSQYAKQLVGVTRRYRYNLVVIPLSIEKTMLKLGTAGVMTVETGSSIMSLSRETIFPWFPRCYICVKIRKFHFRML